MFRAVERIPVAIALACGAAFADVQLEPVTVVSSRTPRTPADATRNVGVMTREDIETLPVDNVIDLLDYLPGIDLQKRGPRGVQADVSVRGSTFEQVAVVVDGVRVKPQPVGFYGGWITPEILGPFKDEA